MKTLFITGANQGIGYYLVEKFLENQNQVAVVDLAIENLEGFKKKYPNTLLCFQGDVTDKSFMQQSIEATIQVFEKIDYAIHNACKCLFTSFEKLSNEEYNKVMQINFEGARNLSSAVIPHMILQKQGKIFFVSSGVGVTGFINISAYAASKGAIEAYAKCMNLEYENTGISFHIIHPPLTNTKSAEPLPIPKEFKANPKDVGYGLANRLHKNKFIICHSLGQSLQTKMCYLFPIFTGKMMSKMAIRANEQNK